MVDDHYAHIAPHYEKLLGKILYPMRRNICTFVKHCGYRRVLDLCCGTGRQLEMMATENMELYGVDSSPAMLDQTSKFQNIHFIKENVADLDLHNESYDAVILSLALHEKNEMDREVILQTSWKLVKPEGHLIIADYCQPPLALRSAIFNYIIKFIEKMAGKDHYDNYCNWMDNGALENHISHYGARKEIISFHLCNTLLSCAIYKQKRDYQFFHLLS